MTNKPLETFRIGSLDFAIWENQGEDLRTFHTFSIKRSYLDTNGQWQEGGEIRLLPQQGADFKLGVDKLYEFWRLGIKRRRPTQADEGRREADSQQSQHNPVDDSADHSGAEATTDQHEGGENMAEKATSGRKSARSR